jgi:hypothetical protein
MAISVLMTEGFAAVMLPMSLLYTALGFVFPRFGA